MIILAPIFVEHLQHMQRPSAFKTGHAHRYKLITSLLGQLMLHTINIVQALVNIAIALGLMPVTGITLPFISYGGTSLVISLAAVGVLLNISRHARLDIYFQN